MSSRLTAAFDPLAPDAALLDRFRRERDGAAFAQLVRRHGPLVLGVCRRVTGDVHLADDAFQAAWLVLARKPEAVAPAAGVRGFLYGVAVRVSRKARSRHGRRLRHERPAGRLPEVAVEPTAADPDQLRLLTEAVGRLPDHLRAAVVLCELDGLSRADAAGRLGIPPGTLSSRLAKARLLLASGLSRRGVTFSKIGAAGGSAAVSPALASAAVALGTGGSAAAGVSALAGAAMPSANWGRVLLMAVLGVGLMGGAAAWPSGGPADDPPPAPAAAKPKPKPADPGKLIVWQKDRYRLLDPTGTELDERKFTHPDELPLAAPVLSPDGRSVAFRVEPSASRIMKVVDPQPAATSPAHLMIFPFGGGPGRRLDVDPVSFFWLPGGQLLVTTFDQTQADAGTPYRTARVDLATGDRTPFDLPQSFVPKLLLPDGRTFAGIRLDVSRKRAFLSRVVAGGQPDDVYELASNPADPRLSPDGTRLLTDRLDKPADPAVAVLPMFQRLYVADLVARSVSRLPGVPDDVWVVAACWSPDGKRVAYLWWQPQAIPPRPTDKPGARRRYGPPAEATLTVADADGGNPKAIGTVAVEQRNSMAYGGLDWR